MTGFGSSFGVTVAISLPGRRESNGASPAASLGGRDGVAPRRRSQLTITVSQGLADTCVAIRASLRVKVGCPVSVRRDSASRPVSFRSSHAAHTGGDAGAPKILAVASAVDLDFRYGCTPAWWQLWKGMYEAGVDLIVTPYRGRAVESPWWRTAPNPLLPRGRGFAARARRSRRGSRATRYLRRAEEHPEDTRADKLVARGDLAVR